MQLQSENISSCQSGGSHQNHQGQQNGSSGRPAGLKILSLERSSPLFGYLRPDDYLVSINDEPVEDIIDFHFKLAEDEVDLIFKTADEELLLFEFSGVSAGELGLTFDQESIRTCRNKCVFCFIMQQPEGMRRSLYVMDEDFRYSFTHGNFVTLSNTSDQDIERIIAQRLSPLYVSVHATDDTLRRCMLKNELLDPIVPRLKQLIEGGIEIHTQVVLCPGLNDGAALEKTIADLSVLHPGVVSLALAPVGLTKYRQNLPELSIYSAESAGELLDNVRAIRKRLLRDLGTRFVWPADEFYTIAGRDFPTLKSYEDLSQFENGVGMCRSLITTFNRKKKSLAETVGNYSDQSGRLVALTGVSAGPWLEEQIGVPLREMGVDIVFHALNNRFWGDSVTVSGLLTGADLLQAARKLCGAGDTLVLPPNCLNNDDLFLDNMTLESFRQQLGSRTVIGGYDMAETIRRALSPDSRADSQGSESRLVAFAEAV